MTKTRLRQGFTTGTAATAAGMAALGVLLGDPALGNISVPLPGAAERLQICVARCIAENGDVRGVVRKDAGDDPDVTHGAEIHALVRVSEAPELRVEIKGGRGVGRVTLPGLAVPVGEPAINPGPRSQIEAGLREVAQRHGFRGRITVLVEVPEGESLARRTMNPRLGIVGGISILGSHGIVRPYSHDAWAASVSQELRVARAEGHELAVFTTGRRSERLYLERFPRTPARCMVQAADFFAHACTEAASLGFRRLGWSVFFGKLVKQAQGFANTHAGSADIDFMLLARWCAEAGAPWALCREAQRANTARQVLGLLRPEHPDVLDALLRALANRAVEGVLAHAPQADVHYAVFDFDGELLHATRPAPDTGR